MKTIGDVIEKYQILRPKIKDKDKKSLCNDIINDLEEIDHGYNKLFLKGFGAGVILTIIGIIIWKIYH